MNNDSDFQLPRGYQNLRSFSVSSRAVLCREDTSGRLIVIKSSSMRAEQAFRREVRALNALDDFSCSPRLYFAIPQENPHDGFHLGMEFCLGRPLINLRENLRQQDVNPLRQALWACLDELHRVHRIAHCDISPGNILVQLPEAGQTLQIKLLDWEFSEPLDRENTASHDAFRGTPGYVSSNTSDSLIEKDRFALRSCLEFLGLNPDPVATPPVAQPKRFLLWGRKQG